MYILFIPVLKKIDHRDKLNWDIEGKGEVVLTLLPGWPNLVHCNLKYCNIEYSNHIQYLRLQGLNYLELQIDSDFIPDIYETLNCLIGLSLIIFESIHVQLWF